MLSCKVFCEVPFNGNWGEDSCSGIEARTAASAGLGVGGLSLSYWKLCEPRSGTCTMGFCSGSKGSHPLWDFYDAVASTCTTPEPNRRSAGNEEVMMPSTYQMACDYAEL